MRMYGITGCLCINGVELELSYYMKVLYNWTEWPATTEGQGYKYIIQIADSVHVIVILNWFILELFVTLL